MKVHLLIIAVLIFSCAAAAAAAAGQTPPSASKPSPSPVSTPVPCDANCNKNLANQKLKDGSEAYKNRKFEEAEILFREAFKRDPELKKARLFLARTLHSHYASDRNKTAKAVEAIAEYKNVMDEHKKILADNNAALDRERTPCSYSAYEIGKLQGGRKTGLDAFTVVRDSLGAVANLLDSLQRPNERLQWLNRWGEDAGLPACLRAGAYTSLAARENTCANDITEDPAVKKAVQKDGKTVFTFSKPSKAGELETLKGCIRRGMDLIDKALVLDAESDSAWSYKASLLIQNMRLAEMEGRTADKERLKTEAERAKAKFTELAKRRKEKTDAEEIMRKAEEPQNNK